MKSLELFSTLRRSPEEFLDRMSAIFFRHWESSFGGQPEYRTVGVDQGIESLSGALGEEFAKALAEPGLAEIEHRVTEKQTQMPANAPFAKYHNGDALLGRMCYAVCRALRPGTIVETGVCYGVTSAYLLAALEANGDGHLESIDLPPLAKNGDDFVGWLVPGDLAHRWSLHRGASARLLRPLVARLGPIDLFVHDSLHTYKNMRAEFEGVWPALRAGGILISDDVQGNGAFLELARSKDVSMSAVIQEKNKPALLGVAVKRK